jgi:AraC-like DNA-binding protein
MRSRLNHIKNWAELAALASYNVHKLAEVCKVSERQLERFFIETLDKTPHLWLTELRQNQALTLMKRGMTVKETAANLSYRQAGHFSREFKRFFGFTPTGIAEDYSANVAFRY